MVVGDVEDKFLPARGGKVGWNNAARCPAASSSSEYSRKRNKYRIKYRYLSQKNNLRKRERNKSAALTAKK
jgi:hypothetical protein